MGKRYRSLEQDKDLAQYTQHAGYNEVTKKPYVEIKKNGEHYCYIPWEVWKK